MFQSSCVEQQPNPRSHTAPRLQPCSGTRPSGRALLAQDRDADTAKVSVQLGAGCLSLGLRQSKREHGPEPWDTKQQQWPAARASLSRVLQNQQGQVVLRTGNKGELSLEVHHVGTCAVKGDGGFSRRCENQMIPQGERSPSHALQHGLRLQAPPGSGPECTSSSVPALPEPWAHYSGQSSCPV